MWKHIKREIITPSDLYFTRIEIKETTPLPSVHTKKIILLAADHTLEDKQQQFLTARW